MTFPTMMFRPRTLDEALQYLRQPNTVALAGGALLLGGVLLPYEQLVDVQDIAELQELTPMDDGFSIGGGVMLAHLYASAPPYVQAAIGRVIPANVRHNLSVHEALVAAGTPFEGDSAGIVSANTLARGAELVREWACLLAALNARVVHTGYRAQEQTLHTHRLSLAEFWQGLADGALYQGLVLRLSLPLAYADVGQSVGMAQVSRTPADVPIVCACAYLERDAQGALKVGRVALAGASVEAVRVFTLDAHRGAQLDEARCGLIAEEIREQVQPLDNYKASAAYRQVLAQVLTKRALLDALNT